MGGEREVGKERERGKRLGEGGYADIYYVLSPNFFSLQKYVD